MKLFLEMNLEFTNPIFSEFLMTISKQSREAVFSNISKVANFKEAIKCIGSDSRVNVVRLTNEELELYKCINNHTDMESESKNKNKDEQARTLTESKDKTHHSALSTNNNKSIDKKCSTNVSKSLSQKESSKSNSRNPSVKECNATEQNKTKTNDKNEYKNANNTKENKDKTNLTSNRVNKSKLRMFDLFGEDNNLPLIMKPNSTNIKKNSERSKSIDKKINKFQKQRSVDDENKRKPVCKDDSSSKSTLVKISSVDENVLVKKKRSCSTDIEINSDRKKSNLQKIGREKNILSNNKSRLSEDDSIKNKDNSLENIHMKHSRKNKNTITEPNSSIPKSRKSKCDKETSSIVDNKNENTEKLCKSKDKISSSSRISHSNAMKRKNSSKNENTKVRKLEIPTKNDKTVSKKQEEKQSKTSPSSKTSTSSSINKNASKPENISLPKSSEAIKVTCDGLSTSNVENIDRSNKHLSHSNSPDNNSLSLDADSKQSLHISDTIADSAVDLKTNLSVTPRKKEHSSTYSSNITKKSNVHAAENHLTVEEPKRKMKTNILPLPAIQRRLLSVEKSKSNEILPSSESESPYISFSELLVKMKNSSPTQKSIDCEPTQKSIDCEPCQKKNVPEPNHIDSEETYSQSSTTSGYYDSIIFIQEQENMANKIIVRRKTVIDDEILPMRRPITRRHSFHYGDSELEVKKEPFDTSAIKTESNKTLKEHFQSDNIENKKIDDSSNSAKEDLKDFASTTNLEDNKIPTPETSKLLPEKLDLLSINIDEMFPSIDEHLNKTDTITLQVENPSNRDLEEPVNSSGDDINMNKYSKTDIIVGDNSIKQNVLKSRMSTDSAIDLDYLDNDQTNSDILGETSFLDNNNISLVTTENSVNYVKDQFVSLLFIYEQYYKTNEKMKKIKKDTTNKGIKDMYFVTRQNADVVKLYEKLICIKVTHFSTIVFFDLLIKKIKDKFSTELEIEEIIIICFIHHVIWILIENFNSPSDTNFLFNHFTSCQTFEYILARFHQVQKNCLCPKERYNYFVKFPIKIKSTSIRGLLGNSSKFSEILHCQKRTNLSDTSNTPLTEDNAKKHVLSESQSTVEPRKRALSENNSDSIEKAAPTQTKRANTNTTAPTFETKNAAKQVQTNIDIYKNINQYKSYLTNTNNTSKTQENIFEPKIIRTSPTSIEVKYDLKQTFDSTPNIQQPKSNISIKIVPQQNTQPVGNMQKKDQRIQKPSIQQKHKSNVEDTSVHKAKQSNIHKADHTTMPHKSVPQTKTYTTEQPSVIIKNIVNPQLNNFIPSQQSNIVTPSTYTIEQPSLIINNIINPQLNNFVPSAQSNPVTSSAYAIEQPSSTTKNVIDLQLRNFVPSRQSNPVTSSAYAIEQPSSTTKNVIDLQLSNFVPSRQSNPVTSSAYAIEQPSLTTKNVIDLQLNNFVPSQQSNPVTSSAYAIEQPSLTTKNVIDLQLNNFVPSQQSNVVTPSVQTNQVRNLKNYPQNHTQCLNIIQPNPKQVDRTVNESNSNQTVNLQNVSHAPTMPQRQIISQNIVHKPQNPVTNCPLNQNPPVYHQKTTDVNTSPDVSNARMNILKEYIKYQKQIPLARGASSPVSLSALYMKWQYQQFMLQKQQQTNSHQSTTRNVSNNLPSHTGPQMYLNQIPAAHQQQNSNNHTGSFGKNVVSTTSYSSHNNPPSYSSHYNNKQNIVTSSRNQPENINVSYTQAPSINTTSTVLQLQSNVPNMNYLLNNSFRQASPYHNTTTSIPQLQTNIMPNVSQSNNPSRSYHNRNLNHMSAMTSQLSYDMNSVSVQNMEIPSNPLHQNQPTTKWMEKNLSTSTEMQDTQNRLKTNLDLRNASRDSGYLTPEQQMNYDFICNKCLGPATFLCSGCCTAYCSPRCQELAWPLHKTQCYTAID